jgi:hypothetical protein
MPMPLFTFSPPEDEPVEVFDFTEVTLTATDTSRLAGRNPFTDVAVRATLTPPGGGEPLTVDGFCDAEDGSIFRVRFMPRVAGRHGYRVTVTLDGETVAEQEGAFEARDAGRRGPVRVDGGHPWHFVHESGERYWYNGTTTYWLLGWDEGNIERILDRLGGLGVTRVRAALSGRVESGRAWDEDVFPGDGFSFCLNPWAAARPDSVPDPGWDVTRFNLPFWRRCERALRLARERSIEVSVIFYVDGARPGVDPFGKEGAGGEDERRYYRYAVARLAAFANVQWDVTNEYRLFRDDPWANAMGTFLKEIDPYDHLVSVHGHGTFTFRDKPWADMALLQCWDEFGGNAYMVLNRGLQKDEGKGRIIPQVNEENGYEDHYPQGWGGARVAPARSADNRRRLAWGIYLAGCYQTTGERATPCGGWINGRGEEGSTELLGGLARIRTFFGAFPYWRCAPQNDLVRHDGRDTDVLCLAEPGATYAVWVPEARSVTINLRPGVYEARWFDPRHDAPQDWHHLPDVQSDSGGVWTSPTPPPGAGPAVNWALLLTRRTI